MNFKDSKHSDLELHLRFERLFVRLYLFRLSYSSITDLKDLVVGLPWSATCEWYLLGLQLQSDVLLFVQQGRYSPF